MCSISQLSKMLRAHAGSAWRLDSCELEALIACDSAERGDGAAAGDCCSSCTSAWAPVNVNSEEARLWKVNSEASTMPPAQLPTKTDGPMAIPAWLDAKMKELLPGNHRGSLHARE